MQKLKIEPIPVLFNELGETALMMSRQQLHPGRRHSFVEDMRHPMVRRISLYTSANQRQRIVIRIVMKLNPRQSQMIAVAETSER